MSIRVCQNHNRDKVECFRRIIIYFTYITHVLWNLKRNVRGKMVFKYFFPNWRLNPRQWRVGETRACDLKPVCQRAYSIWCCNICGKKYIAIQHSQMFTTWLEWNETGKACLVKSYSMLKLLNWYAGIRYPGYKIFPTWAYSCTYCHRFTVAILQFIFITGWVTRARQYSHSTAACPWQHCSAFCIYLCWYFFTSHIEMKYIYISKTNRIVYILEGIY